MMNGSQDTFDVIVRSSDRTGGTPSNYEVHLPGLHNLNRFSHFYVSSVTMRGSRYNITEPTNRFTVDLFGLVHGQTLSSGYTSHTSFSATVAPGHYTNDELAIALRTALQDTHTALFPSANTLSLSVTHDDIRNKFVIEVAQPAVGEGAGRGELTGVYWPDLAAGGGLYTYASMGDAQSPGYASSLNALLGFADMSAQRGSYTGGNGVPDDGTRFEANHHHRYNILPSLLLSSDAASFSVGTTSVGVVPGQILCSVAEPGFGSYGVWEPSTYPLLFPVSRDHSSLRFWWADEFGEEPEFNGVDHIITLRFVSPK